MSLTFNSNNNYSVEIITEPDLANPSVIEYSATTNTPFVTVKIIPTSPQTAPVLASNIKINDIIPYFSWNENVNYNVKGICEPPATPHGVNSSIQHVTGIGVANACQAFGHTSFFGNSNEPQQGPYEAQNDSITQTSEITANGISWSEIILIEVYEDDLGELINDNHSPAVAENYNEWLMWSGPVSTPGGMRREITTNIYPVYLKAFVYLNFGSGGISGVTSSINLNLDIDEVEPTYGCTDPTSVDYDSLATVDDGSCTYPVPEYSIAIQNTYLNTNPVGAYIDPPHLSEVPCYPNNFTYIFQGFVNTINLTGTHSSMPSNARLYHKLLASTYTAGTLVTDLVHVIINPQYGNYTVSQGHNTQGIAIYTYPGENNPDNAVALSSTPADASTWMGDALNNLTAASVQIDNLSSTDSDGNPVTPRPTYLGHNVTHDITGNTSINTPWLPDPGSGWVDEDGNYPTTIVEWGDSQENEGPIIHSLQADGTTVDIQTMGLWAEEIHSTDPNLNAQFPGSLYFPRKVKLYIALNFVMPSDDVLINLDIRHNNEYLNWI